MSKQTCEIDGRKFGVSSNMIGHIRDGKQWSDI